MGLKSWIRKGIGLAGKAIGHVANHMTGGLASKVAGAVSNFASKHAGTIGKVASGIGKAIFSDETRNKISKFADKALDYLPDSKVKDTLSKINNTAQGRNELYNTKPNKFKSPDSRIAPGEGSVYGNYTGPIKKSRKG